LLWESDIMVHNAIVAPSGEREALGVVLIEAGAMGLPVVSCRVGGIPEAVADGDTGLLADEGDLAGLAERVAMLASDPGLRHKMGLAAMRRARREFDSAFLATKLETVYDRILAK
jgi:glycosyltransferase involved in cell wall biosynthesis